MPLDLQLRTDRLRLRPLTLTDAPALHALLDVEEEMWVHQHGYPFTIEERQEAISSRIEDYERYGFGCFAVELASTGELIGQCGLSPHEFESEDGSVSVEFEVMYAIGTAFQNRGFATEAARKWVRYAFDTAGLNRLVVCPLKANVASIRVLEHLGFRIEDDWLEPESVIAYLERQPAS
jgi:RimJ/RimL family protein N-acetyltransferase